jgi:hypothetical protein
MFSRVGRGWRQRRRRRTPLQIAVSPPIAVSLMAAVVPAALVIAALIAIRRRRGRDAVAEPPSGPEVPDTPLGVPADAAANDGPVELPGFPRTDPTHG